MDGYINFKGEWLGYDEPTEGEWVATKVPMQPVVGMRWNFAQGLWEMPIRQNIKFSREEGPLNPRDLGELGGEDNQEPWHARILKRTCGGKRAAAGGLVVFWARGNAGDVEESDTGRGGVTKRNFETFVLSGSMRRVHMPTGTTQVRPTGWTSLDLPPQERNVRGGRHDLYFDEDNTVQMCLHPRSLFKMTNVSHIKPAPVGRVPLLAGKVYVTITGGARARDTANNDLPIAIGEWEIVCSCYGFDYVVFDRGATIVEVDIEAR